MEQVAEQVVKTDLQAIEVTKPDRSEMLRVQSELLLANEILCIKAFSARIPVLGKRKASTPVADEIPVQKKPKYDSDPNLNPEGPMPPHATIALPVTEIQVSPAAVPQV